VVLCDDASLELARNAASATAGPERSEQPGGSARFGPDAPEGAGGVGRAFELEPGSAPPAATPGATHAGRRTPQAAPTLEGVQTNGSVPAKEVRRFGSLSSISKVLLDVPGQAASSQARRRRLPWTEALRKEAGRALTAVFTSGTSSRPKAVLHSASNHEASACAGIERVDLRPGDRWLSVVPMHHVAGISILVRAAIAGATVVFGGEFDARWACALIERHAVTHVSLVPTMLARMLDEGLRATGKLRCVLVGGGPIGADLVVRCLAAGLPVFPTYGLTETASQVVTATPTEARYCPGTCGTPLEGVELRIDQPDAGGYGEILVRGPQVAIGYFDHSGALRPVTRDGWLHTGDIGRVDEAGRLYVVTRRTDLIVSGGENVAPEEVEAVLRSHPDVADAAVVGVDDPRWGQRVAAVLVAGEGRSVDVQAVEQWCRSRLAPHKLPRSITTVDRLPYSPNGKLLRREVRRLVGDVEGSARR
ncbi:MAG: o-succinylbenzoate--CoA ligase, partial [Deltaproteobacteria bacterium]